VGTAAKRFALQVCGPPTDELDDSEAGVGTPEPAKFACHLRRELTGRAKHDGLNGTSCENESLKDWQGKRRGLSTSRFGLPDEILTGKQHGNARTLNGRGTFVAKIANHQAERGRERVED
jgi:hypothetical protein